MTITKKPATTIRHAAVKLPVQKRKVAKKRGVRKIDIPLEPLTNHIPIGFVAPSTAVEGTMIPVTVSFNSPPPGTEYVEVYGCWSGTSTEVAGPIDVAVGPGNSNGTGSIKAPKLSGAPNNLLVLEADYDYYSLVTSVTILPKPVTS